MFYFKKFLSVLIIVLQCLACGSAQQLRIPLTQQMTVVRSDQSHRRAESPNTTKNPHAFYPDTGNDDKISLVQTASPEFFGTLSVGNPKQPFYVIFDSTSEYFWLPSKSCSSCACQTHDLYDFNQSSTAVSIGTHIHFGTNEGDFSGQLVQDELQIQDFLIEKQVFSEIKKIDSLTYGSRPWDGSFGLKLARSSSSHQSPIERLYKERLIESELWSLYINDSSSNPTTGYLILGGIDSKLYHGDLSYFPLLRSKSALSLEFIMFHGMLIRVCSCLATFDTTLDGIILPENDGIEIHRILNATAVQSPSSKDQTRWQVNCKHRDRPQFVLAIFGQEFTIHWEHLIRKTSGNTCETVFRTRSAMNVYTLGLPFFRNYYTVWDKTKVRMGFAQSTGVQRHPLNSIFETKF